MMLYSIYNKQITKLNPKRKKIIDLFKAKISERDLDLIIKDIDLIFDRHESFNSSFEGSGHWLGTAKELITKACDNNKETASGIFGLLIYEHAIDRVDGWQFISIDRGTWYNPIIESEELQ